MQEWIGADKAARAVQSVAVAKRSRLLDKAQLFGPVAGRRSVGLLVAGTNDHADFINARAYDLLNDDLERRFLDSITIHESLKGKTILVPPSRGNDCLADFHFKEAKRTVKRDFFRFAVAL
jgi:hypothetical protein